MKIKTTQLQEQLKHASKDALDEIVSAMEAVDFSDMMTQLLKGKGLNKSELIQKTNLDRTYAYQILQGTKMPSKDKVLQLCIALDTNIEETNRLLTLSENAPLYAKVKRDSIIIYAIEHHFTLMETNEILNSYNLDILE